MAVPEVSRLIRSLLEDVGEDPTRDGLRDTPKRVAKAYVDALSGYSTHARSVIGSAVFHEPLVSRGSGGVVLVRDIDFAATCDTTLMPFHGQCHVAYVPTDSSILGLSKLARLVHAFSKRLCSPDGLCHELTQAIGACTPSNGVYVQVAAKHLASAATQQHVFAESYTGVFDQPHSTQLQEARLLLRCNTRGGAQIGGNDPSSHPDSPRSTPAETPRAHLRDTVASKVACVYATLLHDTGSSLRPGAAEAFANVFLRQTSGYFATLPRILAQHAQHELAQVSAQPPAKIAAADSAATLLTDLSMHDGPPDSPASTPASDAADTPDTQSASSSGMRSCSCRCGAAAAERGAAPPDSHLALRPRLSDLSFGCSSSESSLSDRLCGAAGGRAGPAWQPFCGGRVRLLDAATARPSGGPPLAAGDPGPRDAADAAAASTQTWSVDFATQCEHHILPFYGTLHAVVAGGRPLTAACLCDIVDMFALRLQVQERLTHQVADALHEATGAAVLVVCNAAHMCMVARGVEKHAAETLTTAARGWLEGDALTRNAWLERLLDNVGS